MNAASLTSPKPSASALKIAEPASARRRNRSPAPRPAAMPAHQGWPKRLTTRASAIAGKITRSRIKRCSKSKKITCTSTRMKTLRTSSVGVMSKWKAKTPNRIAVSTGGPKTCQRRLPGCSSSSRARRTEPHRTNHPAAAPTTAQPAAGRSWFTAPKCGAWRPAARLSRSTPRRTPPLAPGGRPTRPRLGVPGSAPCGPAASLR